MTNEELDRELVAEWLEVHGGPRRFDMGVSSSDTAIFAYLTGLGYDRETKANGKIVLTSKTDTHTLADLKELRTLVDVFRVARGKAPFNRTNLKKLG